MKKYIIPFITLLAVFSCQQQTVPTQEGGIITGKVMDAVLLQPMMGVQVEISPGGNSQITVSDGVYKFDDLSEGEYTVIFSKSGYVNQEKKVTVRSGRSSNVDVMLTAVNNSGNGGSNGGTETGGVTVTRGLLAYYTFDDESCNDTWNNKLHAVPHGDPSFIEDTPNGEGKALSLDWGKEQFMSIPYNPLKSYSAYTITFWLKDFAFGIIFSALSSGDYNMNYPDLVRSDYPRLLSTLSGQFRFYSGYDNWDTSPSFSIDTYEIMNSGWHHIGLVVNGDIRYLYLDGQRVDVNEGPSQRPPYSEWIPDTYIFGGDKNGIYEQATSMKLDNIRFYFMAHTNESIAEIYESEK